MFFCCTHSIYLMFLANVVWASVKKRNTTQGFCLQHCPMGLQMLLFFIPSPICFNDLPDDNKYSMLVWNRVEWPESVVLALQTVRQWQLGRDVECKCWRPHLPSSIYGDGSANIACFPIFHSPPCQSFSLFWILAAETDSSQSQRPWWPWTHTQLRKSPPTLPQKFKWKNTMPPHSPGGLSTKDRLAAAFRLNSDIHKSNGSIWMRLLKTDCNKRAPTPHSKRSFFRWAHFITLIVAAL